MARSILTTSPALIRCSPASAKPRSANTLPEPGSISRVFLFSIPHLAVQLFEPLPDQVPNGDGVDRMPGSAFIVRNNFHYPASQTVQGLGTGAHFAQLRQVQSVTNNVLNASRERFHTGAGIGEPPRVSPLGTMPILASRARPVNQEEHPAGRRNIGRCIPANRGI